MDLETISDLIHAARVATDGVRLVVLLLQAWRNRQRRRGGRHRRR